VEFTTWDYEKATELGHLIASDIEVGEVEVVEMAYGWYYTETATYKVVDFYGWTFYMA
jgi:hypothetical protein